MDSATGKVGKVSRVAEALPHSEGAAYKRQGREVAACLRDWRMGPISVDGPGQHNPARSEGPWGRARTSLAWRCSTERRSATLSTDEPGATESTKGDGKPRDAKGMPGAGLTGAARGKASPDSQPSSRTGENPPYGMIGEAMETSASFEARSAPSPYPTACHNLRSPTLAPAPRLARGRFGGAMRRRPRARATPCRTRHRALEASTCARLRLRAAGSAVRPDVETPQ